MSFSGTVVYMDRELRPDLEATQPAGSGAHDETECTVYVPDAEYDGKQPPEVAVFHYEHGVLLRILKNSLHFRLSEKTPSYLLRKGFTTVRCSDA